MPAGTSLSDLGEGAAAAARGLRDLGPDFDYVLIDAGSGLGPGVALLAAEADQVVIVSTPEPTSLADAHAAISRFHQSDNPPRLRVLLNQATSSSEALEVLDGFVNSSRQFKGAVVTPLGPGFIRLDAHVPMAVRSRRPFVTAFPAAVASRGLRRTGPGHPQRATRPRSNGAGRVSCRAGGASVCLVGFRRPNISGRSYVYAGLLGGNRLKDGVFSIGVSFVEIGPKNAKLSRRRGRWGSIFRVVVMIALKPTGQAVRYKIGWKFLGWREEKGLTGRFLQIRQGRPGLETSRRCDARRDFERRLIKSTRRHGSFAQDVPPLAQPTWRSGCQQRWMWM